LNLGPLLTPVGPTCSGPAQRFIYYYICLQKRAPDLITGGCEPPCACWDLNSGPSEEQ
ncbi:hypothetical protein T4D_499, partial [Trichinella pseudospiralis]